MSTHIESVFGRPPLRARSRALAKIILYRGLTVVVTVLAALLVTGSVGDVGEYVNARDWVGPHLGARDPQRNRTACHLTIRRKQRILKD